MPTSKANTLIEIQWCHKTQTKCTYDMESGGATTTENSRDQLETSNTDAAQ
jgi:hypothetical protein